MKNVKKRKQKGKKEFQRTVGNIKYYNICASGVTDWGVRKSFEDMITKLSKLNLTNKPRIDLTSSRKPI